MIELLDDPARFAEQAGALLASTVLNTVLATALESILSGRLAGPPACFAIVRDGAGAVIGAALRTPPRGLVCTELSADAARELMTRWLEEDPGLPSVYARTPTVRALAAAHRAVTGAPTRLETSMALHVLDPDELTDPPRPAAGRLRAPSPAEEALVLDWVRAFTTEAGTGEDPAAAAASARARLAHGLLYVWDDGGEPVSLVGHTPMVAGVPRVALVYTPPERRKRGYAGTAVAALSRRRFDAGARQVVLFTDLANPTANRIYAELGYRRLADFEQHAVS